MTWKAIFTSSVGRKFVMGFTGIFLISFLIIHVGINACIWAMDGGIMFNKAAHFMGSTVVIRIMEVGLFAGFIAHIVQGYLLELENRAKRGTAYQVNMGNKGSKWYSRSMGLLGTLILLFLLLHLAHFWVPARFTHAGLAPIAYENTAVMHDMYGLMKATFTELWIVIAYVLGCISLAWHLMHGFHSAFRSLGIHNPRYLGMLQTLGYGFSLVVSLAFAMMPVSMYMNWVP